MMFAAQDFSGAARRAAHVAATALGWRPGEFWTATPAELVTALGLDLGLDAQPQAPADTAKLAALMEAFPDG
ncbi:phage tail assembly chaperone [Sandarakinorhabdus sp.]|uniref:phage tail assembly chaperone n=1 Tax=Sandarakinorhabdus sp. TaxID=1916663 RepID=UPI0033418B1E